MTNRPDDKKATSCNRCRYFLICPFDKKRKMYNKECHIEKASQKLRKSGTYILCTLSEMGNELGSEPESIAYQFPKETWLTLSEPEKKREMAAYIEHFQSLRKKWDKDYHPRPIQDISHYIPVLVAILNTCFDAWRNEQYVRCLKCGDLIENNKQHNRKYCDKCAGYQRVGTVWKTCVDCGEDYPLHGQNRKSFRCPECQAAADRESSRLRSQRYRERKKSRLQLKE